MADNRFSIIVDAKTAAARVELDRLGKQAETSFDQARVAYAKFQASVSNTWRRVRDSWVGLAAGSAVFLKTMQEVAERDRSIFAMSQTFQDSADIMIAKAKSMSEAFNYYFNFDEISYAFTKTADSMARYGITGEKYLALVERAVDVAAAKNLELKDSIDRIESAMRGEAEASEYLGLTLNDTYMKNIAFDGALKKVWEGLDDNTKAGLRYLEMMQQSEKYTGAAEKASNTLGGSLRTLSNSLREHLIPQLSDANTETVALVKTFTDNVPEISTAIKNIYATYKEIPDEITGAAAYGVMGRILFGGWGPAKVVGAVALLNNILKSADADIGVLYRDSVEFGEAIDKIWQVMKGDRHWNTGVLQGGAADMFWLKIAAEQNTPKIVGNLEKTVDVMEEVDRVIKNHGNTSKKTAVEMKKLADGYARAAEGVIGLWEAQAAERYDVQSRGIDGMIEKEERLKEEGIAAAEGVTDFWMIKANERWEVHSRGLDAIAEAEEAANRHMVQLSERTAEDMERNFSDLYFDAITGKFKRLEDYVQGVLESIARATSDVLGQMTKELIFGTGGSGGGGFLSGALGFVGSLFGGGASAAPAHVGAGATTAFGMAKGAALPGISAYENRVVTQPTVFPFAAGGRFGLMGEAGWEAVMPLTRTRSGNLGVEATVAPVNVTVHNYAGADVAVSRDGQDIDVIIRRAVAAVAADMQSGGVTAAAAVRASVRDLKARGSLRETMQAVM